MDEAENPARKFLNERPDGEHALREVLEIDDERDCWTFHDVTLDSGTFGELVSRGIINQEDDQYRLGNPQQVRDALSEDTDSHDDPATQDWTLSTLVAAGQKTDLRRVALFGGLLLLVAVVRVVFVSSLVFGENGPVLLGNDPYYYRYWIQELTSGSYGAFDPATLTNLPEGIANHDVGLIVVLWWVVTLFGGGQIIIDTVLVIYPVVAAVVVAAVVSLIAKRLTGDDRIALLSIAFLAITPIFAARTALGYADHDPLDFVFIAFTLYGLVGLMKRHDQDSSRLGVKIPTAATTAFVVGTTGQLLNWRGGPLFVAPVLLVAAVGVLADIRADTFNRKQWVPLLVGLTVAAFIMGILTLVFNWTQIYRAGFPALLLVGLIIFIGLGELATKYNLSTRALALAIVGTGLLGATLIWLVIPSIGGAAIDFVEFLRWVRGKDIGETAFLFTDDLSVVLGPVVVLGGVFVLAIPVMAWATLRAYVTAERSWLALTIYGWFTFLFAILQFRFAAVFAIPHAIFSGVGFVYFTSWLEVSNSPSLFASSRNDDSKTSQSVPLPSRQQLQYGCLAFLLVAGFGIVQTPLMVADMQFDSGVYETANWLEDNVESTGDEELYVFSERNHNRVYNSFAGGDPRNYNFANQYYSDFITGVNESTWLSRVGHRIDYIVTRDRGQEFSNKTLQHRLHNHLGTQFGDIEALSQFRAMYRGKTHRVFEVVPGATITGTASPDAVVTVETAVSLNGGNFTYRQTKRATVDGNYAMTVPYAGSYDNTTVDITDVREGGFVGNTSNEAHWPLNDERGQVAFDAAGGNHGWLDGVKWTEGVDGSGLAFDGNAHVRVPAKGTLNATEEGLTAATWVQTDSSVDYRDNLSSPRLVSKAPGAPFRETDGYLLALRNGRAYGVVGNGDEGTGIIGPYLDDSKWHHVALSYNGTYVRLYVDGKQVNTQAYSGSIQSSMPLYLGTATENTGHFVGRLDSVRVLPRPVDRSTVRSWYQNQRPGEQ